MHAARLPTLLPLALAAACGSAPEPTSLLLVTLDTTRADVLSCYGGDARTPAIDGLAEEGVLFENAYSASNVTKPAHVTILTGRRALEHRVFSNQVLVPEEERPLQVVLGERGYDTAAFVAAVQLGERGGWRGFDELSGPKRAFRDGAAVIEEATDWLAAERRTPFFLWVHLFDAHTLYEPPADLAAHHYRGDPRAGDAPLIGEEPFIATWEYKPMQRWIAGVRDRSFAPAMYRAEVEYADRLVGRLFAALDASGHAERTAVVLTADHGESLGEHGVYYDHAGLYEVSLRIPLVVRWPGIAGGRREAALVTQLDLVPTFADLLGFALPARLSGTSLRPLLTGEGRFPEREEHVFESAHNHHVAVRRGRWKAIWPIFSSHRFFSTEPELYDLEADPGETRDLAAEHPEVMAELERFAAPWRALGPIEKGALPEMSPEVRELIREIGYAD